MSVDTVIDTITTNRVLAVIRATSARDAVAYSAEIIRGGITVVEVSLNTPDAIDAIRELSTTPGALIGAGTVRTREQVDQVVEAGASFMVTPHTSADLISHAVSSGLVVGPGVMTPTDCATALDAGAHFLKLFPADVAGVAAMTAMSQPFPEAKWIPTGGIGSQNMVQWLSAGASAVGLGSELTSAGVEGARERSATVISALHAWESGR
jgi:2-dehydro-3-deoxyphosphogluconate aldolase/(4S)-4-hydroxy-2-oxoglutarate aldolase